MCAQMVGALRVGRRQDRKKKRGERSQIHKMTGREGRRGDGSTAGLSRPPEGSRRRFRNRRAAGAVQLSDLLAVMHSRCSGQQATMGAAQNDRGRRLFPTAHDELKQNRASSGGKHTRAHTRSHKMKPIHL